MHYGSRYVLVEIKISIKETKLFKQMIQLITIMIELLDEESKDKVRPIYNEINERLR